MKENNIILEENIIEKDSKFFFFNGKRICPYCGQEIKERLSSDKELYYQCNCICAKEEVRINEEIKKLKLSLPKEKFMKIKTQVKKVENDGTESIVSESYNVVQIS